ncbi:MULTISPECIES: D-arabinono-1,4-lactone oxidase [Kordiimonas]|uniref:D-arabinono-1,4-lactone oxidase n=1 Tax=Kordiimonas TaxID=288021 RepID=UPI00257ECFAE|nr:D-arabinono-1,4-lactone oxidase [Kordiimonas sp. UBA4487]
MPISRRKLLQGGAAAIGVAAAVPVGQHLMWGAKDFVRPGYSPDFPDAPPGEESWENWSGIERATPTGISYPETESMLADQIRAATGRVRPFGSGHSFTGLAPSEGLMVNVSSMSGLRAFNAQTGYAVFGAGTHLFDVAADLAAHGRALPNMPDIDVQTLAGCFSTATHGTGAQLTALHDYIAGFRLITASGDILDVTAASHADLFAAGKVSLGALGVITEYTLKTVPAFNLRRIVRALPVEEVLRDAEALADKHRNFEFYYFPSTGMAATITHDLHEGPVSGGLASAEDDDLLESLKALRDKFGWWPWLRQQVAQASFPKGVVEDISDAAPKLLSTTRPHKFNETEYHIPRENGVQAVREVIKVLDDLKAGYFPMEVRFIAPDNAWLSPFEGGQRMSIAVHASADEPYDHFFKLVEPIYRAHGGRPHWGKLHTLGRADLSQLYPQFEAFRDLRRSLDPAGKFLNPHLAKIFGEPFDA